MATKKRSELENHTLDQPEDLPEPPPDRSHWVTNLAQLDLEQEVLFHYNLAREYRDSLKTSDWEPNKVAQVLNTMTSILTSLTKAQADLHNAEKSKKLEAVLIRTLRTLPEATQVQFMADYKAALEAAE
jgi:hypothetical protein